MVDFGLTWFRPKPTFRRLTMRNIIDIASISLHGLYPYLQLWKQARQSTLYLPSVFRTPMQLILDAVIL